VHASRNQDRRLAAALLAAGIAHTPEGEEVLRGARMRAARKPSAVARELLRNFPKSGGRRRRRKRKGGGSQENGSKGSGAAAKNGAAAEADEEIEELETGSENGAAPEHDEELEAAEAEE
jgi:ribonuclease E